MSRSRKRSFYASDNHSRNSRRRFMRRYMKRSLRSMLKNSDELLQGSLYKRYGDSWSYCDYKYYYSENDAIKLYYELIVKGRIKGKYPTLESWLKKYRKDMVYK